MCYARCYTLNAIYFSEIKISLRNWFSQLIISVFYWLNRSFLDVFHEVFYKRVNPPGNRQPQLHFADRRLKFVCFEAHYWLRRPIDDWMTIADSKMLPKLPKYRCSILLWDTLSKIPCMFRLVIQLNSKLMAIGDLSLIFGIRFIDLFLTIQASIGMLYQIF